MRWLLSVLVVAVVCACDASTEPVGQGGASTGVTPTDDDAGQGGFGGSPTGQIATGGSIGGGGGSAPVDDGLLALYTFRGDSNVIEDVSGVDPPLDLNMYGTIDRLSGGGVVFAGATDPIAVSPVPATNVIDAVKLSRDISVEVWLRATTVSQAGPARIVSMAKLNHHRNVSVLHGPAACGDHDPGAFFQVRVKNADEDNGCDPSVAVAAAPNVTDVLQHFVFTQAIDGSQITWTDGVISAQDQDVEMNFDTFYDDTPLGLGNEPNNGMDATVRDPGRKWLGELYLVAIYDKALTEQRIVALHALGYEAR